MIMNVGTQMIMVAVVLVGCSFSAHARGEATSEMVASGATAPRYTLRMLCSRFLMAPKEIPAEAHVKLDIRLPALPGVTPQVELDAHGQPKPGMVAGRLDAHLSPDLMEIEAISLNVHRGFASLGVRRAAFQELFRRYPGLIAVSVFISNEELRCQRADRVYQVLPFVRGTEIYSVLSSFGLTAIDVDSVTPYGTKVRIRRPFALW